MPDAEQLSKSQKKQKQQSQINFTSLSTNALENTQEESQLRQLANCEMTDSNIESLTLGSEALMKRQGNDDCFKNYKPFQVLGIWTKHYRWTYAEHSRANTQNDGHYDQLLF